MYETYQQPVWILLYERGGNIYYYSSYAEFIAKTRYLSIGNNSDDYKMNWNNFSWGSSKEDLKNFYDLWAKDEFGNTISKDQIERDRNLTKLKQLRYPNTVYRKDPVPGTTKFKGRYRWYKRPKTTQEMREYYKIAIEEADTGYPIHYRAKRRPHNLPTVWDDRIQTDWKNHSWKEFRKTQYK